MPCFPDGLLLNQRHPARSVEPPASPVATSGLPSPPVVAVEASRAIVVSPFIVASTPPALDDHSGDAEKRMTAH
jgi:hypothetical protein